MNFVGKIVAPFIRAEITALHYTQNILGFFALLPLLNSETSGNQRGPILEKYRTCFDLAQVAFSRLQVGQMRLFSKLGLLDAGYIGRRAPDYLPYLNSREPSPDRRIDRIIAMNDQGMLTDIDAGILLEKETHSSDLSFHYDPDKKSFATTALPDDPASDAARSAVWDKLTDWCSRKLGVLAGLGGEPQRKLAMVIVGVTEGIPMAGEGDESKSIVTSARFCAHRSLCVIFKDVADRRGDPLVATAMHADFLPAMADWLQNDPGYIHLKQEIEKYRRDKERPHPTVEMHDRFTEMLNAYAARKKSGPAAG